MHPCSVQSFTRSMLHSPLHSPSAAMANMASASGMEGEAMILALRVSPLPFFSSTRVVVACAMMLPPMAFICGPKAMGPASGVATTWAGRQMRG